MRLICNNEIQIDKWSELIDKSPYSSPFQTKQFLDIINRVSRYRAHVLAVEDGGDLQALASIAFQKEPGITGFFSRRGIIYGGPLLSQNNQEANKLLIEGISKYFGGEAIYFDTRNAFDYNTYKEIYKLNGWNYSSNLNVKLNIHEKEINEILSGMKYNRKREIRISLDAGTTYRSCETNEELKELYKILQKLYKENVKLPLPPFEYFTGIMNSPVGKIFIVEHNSNIIGGSVCLFLPEKEIYTMYYCGERNYNKKIFPTHLSILAAIEFGVTRKARSLDFMGAGKIEKEYGVRQYKLEFGGELVEHGRFLKISQSTLYYLGSKGLKLYKKFR
jgi:serine/alanine adding enzyme